MTICRRTSATIGERWKPLTLAPQRCAAPRTQSILSFRSGQPLRLALHLDGVKKILLPRLRRFLPFKFQEQPPRYHYRPLRPTIPANCRLRSYRRSFRWSRHRGSRHREYLPHEENLEVQQHLRHRASVPRLLPHSAAQRDQTLVSLRPTSAMSSCFLRA